MKKTTVLFPVLFGLVIIVSVAAMTSVNAQINQNESDMKSVTDNINKSLTKLTGGKSSDLLNNTMVSIKNTAAQIANQSKGVLNKESLNTAEIIAKKIGIGIADVLSNISGEVKQGIVSK
jgi:hypothetical protein